MTSTSSNFSLMQPGRRAGARLASAGLVAGLLSVGAAAPPVGQAVKPGEKKPRQVDYVAGQVESHKNAAGEVVWVLTDDVEFTHVDSKDPQKKMVLTADRVEATEQKDGNTVAVATGHPKATDDRSDVVGEKITLYTKNRRAVVEGSVKIVTRPKKGAEGSSGSSTVASSSESTTATRSRSIRDRVKGEVVITGKRAEYDYRQKTALVEGDVVVKNRGRTLTTPKVSYDDKAETVLLTGPIHGIDEKGQTIDHEADLLVSVKEGDESLHTVGKGRRVHGRLFINEDEDEGSSGTQETKPAPAPAPETKPGETKPPATK